MKRLFALVGLSALIATPAMAADSGYWDSGRDDRGFYVGADLGQYNWSLDENALNQSVVDTLGDLGLNVIDGASETSEDGFTWGLILGYQLLPFLAFEAAYVDLGSAEYKSNVDVTDGTNTSRGQRAARHRQHGRGGFGARHPAVRPQLAGLRAGGRVLRQHRQHGTAVRCRRQRRRQQLEQRDEFPVGCWTRLLERPVDVEARVPAVHGRRGRSRLQRGRRRPHRVLGRLSDGLRRVARQVGPRGTAGRGRRTSRSCRCGTCRQRR